MTEFILTQEMIQEFRQEVAVRIRSMEENPQPGGIAYVGVAPLILGKLLDAAEMWLLYEKTCADEAEAKKKREQMINFLADSL
jgi:hypothetical protein